MAKETNAPVVEKDKSKAAWKELLGMFYPMIIATVLTGMIVFITKI